MYEGRLETEGIVLREFTVGTRKSKLALVQTNWVIEQLTKQHPEVRFQVKEIETSGDKNLNVSLAKLGGQGVFLQELEEQLLAEQVDMAVHSLKDMPVELPEGLEIACIPPREDYRDAYLAKDHVPFQDLPTGAVIGTSSGRRAAQILAMRPDVTTKWIRGPIDSRIEQLEAGHFDATILAVAGLKRLGLAEEKITQYLPEDHFIPAAGQGALAIECRTNDHEMKKILETLHDDATAQAVTAERLFFGAFEEGEQAPIGGCAFVENGELHLRGMVISLDGQMVIQHEAAGQDPAKLAQEVAARLIDKGAKEMIQQANEALAYEHSS